MKDQLPVETLHQIVFKRQLLCNSTQKFFKVNVWEWGKLILEFCLDGGLLTSAGEFLLQQLAHRELHIFDLSQKAEK